jgi:hypothetical protein
MLKYQHVKISSFTETLISSVAKVRFPNNFKRSKCEGKTVSSLIVTTTGQMY